MKYRRMKIRDEGRVINKAANLAIGVGMDGHKDVLGIWIEKNEGAEFLEVRVVQRP